MVKTVTKQHKQFRFSIGIKLGIILAVFSISGSTLTGYYTFNATRDILSKKAAQKMIEVTQVLGKRFSIMGNKVADDTRFLAQTVLIQQVAGNANKAKSFYDILANLFTRLLSVHPEYFQIRLISSKNYGIELVRVDRDNDQLILIKGDDLQEKQHMAYVYETLKLGRGQTYFSKIFINHEKGSHAGHDQPTLQVASPVISDDGKVLGVVVINVDLNRMFSILKSDLDDAYQLYLTNQEGDYLINPVKTKTFGFDVGHRYLLQNDFSSSAEIFNRKVQTIAVQAINNETNNTEIGGFTRIPFGNVEDNRFVVFGLTVPQKFVLAEIDTLYEKGLLTVFVLSLFAIILSAILAQLFIRPVKQLVNSVQLFTKNQQLMPLSVSRKDELGLLAKSIAKMQTVIVTQLNSLNQQNAQLNQEIFEREYFERYEKFRSHTLELLAKNEPLDNVLKAIIYGVEQLRSKMLCSILLLDESGKYVSQSLALCLPDFYNEAVTGLEIGMGIGSCGTAAFTRQRVIVEDIQTHSYWKNYRTLAEKAGLKSCWSQPVFSSSGKVLGTFAIYHHAICSPTYSDIDIMEQSAHLASIAIEHKQVHDEINKLAFYDSLTQLPNRRLLLNHLKQAIASMAHNDTGAALLFIDLDKFKVLNDSLGHDMGDQLLQQVAQRLRDCVRESDTVSRLSGDEFVILLQNLSDQGLVSATHVEAVGRKILTSLSKTYQLSSHRYHIYSSIGALLFEGRQQSAEELLQQADVAMYHAKKAGGNELYFFDPDMQQKIRDRVHLEEDLFQALNNKDQFQLYYQSQVDSVNRVTGAEALVRWISPHRGLVSPLDFISVAEASGLIIPLGRWIMNTACKQLACWAQDPQTAHLTIAVNISARQVRMQNFVEEVLVAIESAAVNPAMLKLEITESLLLDNLEDTIEKMTRLKDYGVNFSIDDFGTGYSSLQYIKRLPLDQLKIDQSFVRDLANDNSDRAIVRTIIVMAKSLNLNVIAEGVETEEQLIRLKNKGCSSFQGYLFSKPVPITEFEYQLTQGRHFHPVIHN